MCTRSKCIVRYTTDPLPSANVPLLLNTLATPAPVSCIVPIPLNVKVCPPTVLVMPFVFNPDAGALRQCKLSPNTLTGRFVMFTEIVPKL